MAVVKELSTTAVCVIIVLRHLSEPEHECLLLLGIRRFIRAILFYGIVNISEQFFFVAIKNTIQNQSEYPTGTYFSQSYCKHHQRNRFVDSIRILENKWHNQKICSNRRKNRYIWFFVSQFPRATGSEQCCQTPENDISQWCSRQ